MAALDWAILVLLTFFAFVILTEIRIWLRQRAHQRAIAAPDAPARRKSASHRLLRRTLGVAIAVAILLLIRYPWQNEASLWIKTSRLAASLGLCFILLVLASWDFRAIRREIRAEIEELNRRSVQDLLTQLDKAAPKTRPKD